MDAIRPIALAAPIALTTACPRPLTTTVPAETPSPACLPTGTDSPVSEDSSTPSAADSITSASAGTMSPPVSTRISGSRSCAATLRHNGTRRRCATTFGPSAASRAAASSLDRPCGRANGRVDTALTTPMQPHCAPSGKCGKSRLGANAGRAYAVPARSWTHTWTGPTATQWAEVGAGHGDGLGATEEGRGFEWTGRGVGDEGDRRSDPPG